jgi:methyl-accepting chemotaxis protein
MKWFNDVKLSVKLFAAILLMTVISGFSGYLYHSTSNVLIIIAGVVLVTMLGCILAKNLSIPALKMNDNLKRIISGDFRISTPETTNDDNSLENIKNLSETLINFKDEICRVVESAKEGNLQSRGDQGKFKGSFAVIIEGINKVLDAISEPLNDSKIVMNKIAANDYSLNMTKNYKGAFGELAASINDVHSHLLNVQNMCINIGKGDISDLERLKETGKRSENDNLIPSLINMMESIKNLYLEITMLTDAISDGKLYTRGDPGKFSGNYAEIISGINDLITAFTTPMHEAREVMAKLSVNDLSIGMSGQYNGLLKDFSESINLVRERILSIQDTFTNLGRGDVSQLEAFVKLGKRSENDKLIPSSIEMMTSIKNLINEAAVLANSAAVGNLSMRGDAGQFKGGYSQIIEGMNRMMEVVEKPITEASEVMQELASGNLTINMEGNYQGDYQKIKDSVNFTIKSFNEVLNEINNAAMQVASGSRQVSDSGQALSQGSTEQASAIEELTSSIEEIASQTGLNAENANKADELAISVQQKAVEGNNQMKEMLKAMTDINEASNNISKIIKVIDDIAFQTNILALNAAVEAARAGQHGKGFAVVAEEVRNLAARSANAAKETTNMIEGSMKKAEGGTKIANETAEALNSIVEGIAKVASLVGDIAAASNEQASGITQINQGIMQVSQVVQTNSATSEESAAASEELSSQAEMLRQMAARFRLKNSTIGKTDMDGVKPDTLKTIESINDRTAAGFQTTHQKVKTKISLGDTEFGKY